MFPCWRTSRDRGPPRIAFVVYQGREAAKHMATPKKTIDPTEAALSAIQEALNLTAEPATSEDTTSTEASKTSGSPTSSQKIEPEAGSMTMRPPQSLEPDLPANTDDTAVTKRAEPRLDPPTPAQERKGARLDINPPRSRPVDLDGGEFQPDLLPEPPAPPANDDRRAVGEILHALNERPTKGAYVFAFLLSLLWIGVGGGLAWVSLGDIGGLLSKGGAGLSTLMAVGASLLFPVALFFIMAHLSYRAQEMRLIGQALTQATLRLSQPETVGQDQMVSLGQAIRREVAAMGDGVERALARAAELESLVGSEVSQLERVYTDNEARVRTLIEELATQRESVLGHAERVREALALANSNLTEDINSATDQLMLSVRDAGERVTSTLSEKGETITQSLGHAGDQVLSAISSRGSELVDELKRTGAEVTGVLDQSSSQLIDELKTAGNDVTGHLSRTSTQLIEDLKRTGNDLAESLDLTSTQLITTLDSRTNEVATRLEGLSESVSEALHQRMETIGDNLIASSNDLAQQLTDRTMSMTETLTRVTATLADTLSTRSQTIADSLIDTGGQLAETIAERAEEVNGTLKATGDSLLVDLSLRGGEVVAKLEDIGGKITDAIANQGGALADRLARTGEQIHETIAVRGVDLDRQLAETGDRVTQSISRTGAQVTELISTRIEGARDAIEQSGQRMVETVARQGGEMSEHITVVGTEVAKAIALRGGKVTEAFRDTAEQLQSAISGKGDAIHEMLESRLAAFEQVFEVKGGDLSQRISADTARLGEIITGSLTDFDNTVKVFGGELVDKLGRRTIDVTEALRAYVDSFDSKVHARTTEVGEAFDSRIAQIGDILDKRGRALDDALKLRSVEIASTLADSTRNANGELEKHVATVLGTISRSAETITEVLAEKAAEVDVRLGSRALEVAATLDEQATRIEAATGRIEINGKALGETLAERLSLFDATLRTGTTDVERALASVGMTMVQNLRGQVEEAAKVMTLKAGDVVATLGNSSQELARLLDERSNVFIAAIEQKGVSVSETVATAASGVARQLAEATDGVTGAINDSTGKAQSAIDAMREVQQALRSDTGAILERLRDTNIVLKDVLTSAAGNLHTIEDQLSQRMKGFELTLSTVGERTEGATERVADQIAAFHSVSTNVLRDVSVLAQRFDDQAQMLQGAAASVEATHRRIDNALDDRRARLDEISAHLAARTEELDTRMSRFASLLEDTIGNSEARAREIARVIGEVTAQTSRALTEKFEAIRVGGEDERQRTAEALGQIADQVSADIRNMFDDAQARFDDVSKQIRTAAADVRRELDSTRTELKRGVLELPKETADSAAEMRRVVSEQIKALGELNDIVARSGRSQDIALPTRQAATRQAEPAYASVVDPVARLEQALRLDQPTTRQDSTLDSTSLARNGLRGSFDDEPARVVNPRRRETPAPTRSGGDGWLSDVLSRASRDEAPQDRRAERPARHALESLDSLSVDIVRTMDPVAAADLWKRYERGERNVFTRKLFTWQSQQRMFDDVRRRYARDVEFQDTVNRFLDEFERLIGEASRREDGAAMVQTYLGSETGKVYTMLAHAGGRFE